MAITVEWVMDCWVYDLPSMVWVVDRGEGKDEGLEVSVEDDGSGVVVGGLGTANGVGRN